DSLHGKLLTLPDHLEIYPAHFGGAACGKGLSGKPMSTLGFERLFNPALQITSKEAFVEFALTDLPEPPPVFAVNRRINAGVG
ncbi:MAG: MBL fold metallo-hydrolase, partial [Candidatus Rokubacteria bacterium]|nr:MBL fold metallo-hydrolase [Candidatus Rokubacteria bacterium]